MFNNYIIGIGSSSNGQNAGNVDKIGIFGVTLCRLALIVFGSVILQVIAERFYNIIRSPFSIFTVGHAFNIIAWICVDKNIGIGFIEGYAGAVSLYKLQ